MAPWRGAKHLQALTQVLLPGGVAFQLHPGLKSHPSPWLKAWPQLFNMSMKPIKGYRYVKWPCQGLAAQLLLYKTALNGPAPCVPSPSWLVGVRTSYIYFSLIFPEHPKFWTPLQIPIWAPPHRRPAASCYILVIWAPYCQVPVRVSCSYLYWIACAFLSDL